MKKKLDGNYTRTLRAILNKSWRQQPKNQQLYGYQPTITKTIKIRRTRPAGHCWRSMDELISDVLLWTPSHERAKARRPALTYIQQLCADTRCSPEDLPEGVAERVRDICANSATWWWWWWLRTSIELIKENDFTVKKKKKARSRRYPAETITDADYIDDLAFLPNTPTLAESLLRSMEQTAGPNGLLVNANKTDFMYFKRWGTISTLFGWPLKLVGEFA